MRGCCCREQLGCLQAERRVAQPVAERVQRAGRRVDVVALPVRPSRRRPCGRSRRGSGPPSGDTRSAACRSGLTSPASTSAMAAAPSWPGSHAISTAAHCSCSQRCRSAARRRARARPACRWRSPPARGPPARPAGRATRRRGSRRWCSRRSARLVAHHHHGHVGRRRRAATASAKPSRDALGDAAAARGERHRPKRARRRVERRWARRRRVVGIGGVGRAASANTFRPLCSTSCERLDVGRVV